jgi:hypothetical protein
MRIEPKENASKRQPPIGFTCFHVVSFFASSFPATEAEAGIS